MGLLLNSKGDAQEEVYERTKKPESEIEWDTKLEWGVGYI